MQLKGLENMIHRLLMPLTIFIGISGWLHAEDNCYKNRFSTDCSNNQASYTEYVIKNFGGLSLSSNFYITPFAWDMSPFTWKHVGRNYTCQAGKGQCPDVLGKNAHTAGIYMPWGEYDAIWRSDYTSGNWSGDNSATYCDWTWKSEDSGKWEAWSYLKTQAVAIQQENMATLSEYENEDAAEHPEDIQSRPHIYNIMGYFQRNSDGGDNPLLLCHYKFYYSNQDKGTLRIKVLNRIGPIGQYPTDNPNLFYTIGCGIRISYNNLVPELNSNDWSLSNGIINTSSIKFYHDNISVVLGKTQPQNKYLELYSNGVVRNNSKPYPYGRSVTYYNPKWGQPYTLPLISTYSETGDSYDPLSYAGRNVPELKDYISIPEPDERSAIYTIELGEKFSLLPDPVKIADGKKKIPVLSVSPYNKKPSENYRLFIDSQKGLLIKDSQDQIIESTLMINPLQSKILTLKNNEKKSETPKN